VNAVADASQSNISQLDNARGLVPLWSASVCLSVLACAWFKPGLIDISKSSVQVLPYIHVKNHSTLLPSPPRYLAPQLPGAEIIYKSSKRLIKECRIMRMGAMGHMYAKLLSQAGWKKPVHIRCVDQH